MRKRIKLEFLVEDLNVFSDTELTRILMNFLLEELPQEGYKVIGAANITFSLAD